MVNPSQRDFMRGTQDPVPKGYMGSNPIPCTKANLAITISIYSKLTHIIITVIDENVLNTDSNRPFKDWMLRNYYVKAVISLPQ